MLTLDQVREEILDLMNTCGDDPEKAQLGIREIFYSLMCADQPFYLIYSDDTPLISPASSDEKNLYLRLFSHEELADKYTQRTGTDCREHSLLDILQVGRWAFLRGACGFILNEGDRWIRITIPEFLSLFFSRIYGDASLCETVCAETVAFINEVRRNGSYHYGMMMGEDGEWTGEVQEGLLPPLTIQNLFDIPADAVRVDKGGIPCSYSKETLKNALAMCGYTPPESPPPYESDYIDEFLDFSSFVEGEWRVEDPEELALSFTKRPTQDDTTEIQTEEAENIPVASAVPVSAKEKKGLFSFLRRKKKASAEAEPAGEAEPVLPDTAIPVPVDTATPEPESVEEPDDTAPEPAVPAEIYDPFQELEKKTEPAGEESHASPFKKILNRKKSSQKDNEKPKPASNSTLTETPSKSQMDAEKSGEKEKKLVGKKGWILVGILAVIFLTGGFFGIRYVQYQENLKSFRAYIASQDYASAYVLYQDAGFGGDADGYLTEEVDGLVLRYANNEISAEELSASLKALSNFRSIAQELEIAKLTASKLEESKNAYVTGKEAEDIYDRLFSWRQVVQLDAVNYAAVQQAVEDNESRYVDSLRADIEYYRTRSLEFAEERVDVLAYWYPENEYVPALVKEFTSTQSVPLSYYPIAISSVRIRQEANSYWTLYINWSNSSVKTIDSICFSVVALGENGEVVTCEDSKGKWTIFDAQDPYRYEPEEEPSFDNYYWQGAFYGPDVRNVKLTAVNIEYRDGSTASYTSDIDLDSIQTN